MRSSPLFVSSNSSSSSSLRRFPYPFLGFLFLVIVAVFSLHCVPVLDKNPAPSLKSASIVAFPQSGSISAGTQISLSASVNAPIYYTLDGTEPSLHSKRYRQPLPLWISSTIRAALIASDGKRSRTFLFRYSIDSTLPRSWAIPSSGNYTKPFKVALKCSEKAKIYYTVDGTLPTLQSPIYSQKIEIKEDTILQFFAVDEAGNREARQNAIYNFPPRLSIWPPPGVYATDELILYVRTNKPSAIYYSFMREEGEFWLRYWGDLRLHFDSDIRFYAVDLRKAKTEPLRVQYAFLAPFTKGDVAIGERETRAMLLADPEGLGRAQLFLAGKTRLSILPFEKTGPQAWQTLMSLGFVPRSLRSWDVDGDGLNDLLIVSEKDELHLFQAQTRKKFLPLSEKQFPFLKGKIRRILPLDYDGDGQLDLLILRPDAPKGELWRKEGFSYTKRDELLIEGNSKALLAGDWDGDNRMDLFVIPPSQEAPFFLYNKGKGRFQSYTLEKILAPLGKKITWLAAARSDMNADALLDVVLVGEMERKKEGDETKKEKVLLFTLLLRLSGGGWKLAYSTQMLYVSLRGLSLFDMDGDGYPDILLSVSQGQPILLKNVLGMRFFEATKLAGLARKNFLAATAGDLGNLGYPSLLMAGAQGYLRIFETKPKGHFLRLLVQGVRGNRSAIGTRITVKIGQKTLLREIGIRSTGPDQTSLLLPIGLGRAKNVSLLTVTWTDGQKREFPHPKIDQTIIVTPHP